MHSATRVFNLNSDIFTPSKFLLPLLLCAAIISSCSSSDISDATERPADPATIQANIYDTHILEDADDLEFVISLTKASPEAVSVEYSSADDSALVGKDYTAVSGKVEFAPGETRKFVTVPVIDNDAAQSTSSKDMQLVLSNPQNVLLDRSTATGTIIDSDTMPTDIPHITNWGSAGAFTDATQCANGCHVSDGSTIMFEGGEDVSPNTQWRHSVMANSFTDPYWQAAVEDESATFPELSGFIEDTCTKCHAPMGNTHAHHQALSGDNSKLDNDGHYRFDTAKDEDIARAGISCTVCHQIDEGNLGSDDSFSGKFVIADSSDADFKKVYGRYPNPDGNAMTSNTGHAPTYGTHISSSALCATCHTLYTPTIDPETKLPTGDSFLEQAVYLEWQNSIYNGVTQCQGCHMPEPSTNYSTLISQRPANGLSARSPYGQQTLAGGNTHLLEILSE